MATPDQTLCEVCHERRVTHHICDGGTGKISDLCDECFETSMPPELRQSTAAMREARCQYCGGQPCAVGTDLLALATGIQQTRFMCIQCTQEFYRYIEQHWQQDASGLSQQEQLAVIRTFCDEVEKHMKQWISERDEQ